MNMKCTSLSDYRARIEGDDLVEIGGGSDSQMGTDSLDADTDSAEALGFSFQQTYLFPAKISYKDAGTLS
jgi:hypothetical protein